MQSGTYYTDVAHLDTIYMVKTEIHFKLEKKYLFMG